MKWLYFSVLILFSHTSIASVMNNNHLDSCFIQAGKRYLIAPELLKTIAQQESGLVATAINHNKNKSGKIISTDYGIMQINSSHIPELKKLGVIKDKDELLKNPCLNIHTAPGYWPAIFNAAALTGNALAVTTQDSAKITQPGA